MVSYHSTPAGVCGGKKNQKGKHSAFGAGSVVVSELCMVVAFISLTIGYCKYTFFLKLAKKNRTFAVEKHLSL